MMILQLHDGTSLVLDHGVGPHAFISHAHKDHLHRVKSREKILSTKETIQLAGIKHTQPYTQPKDVSLLEAGHILGSRQFFYEDGAAFLYSGDIRVKDSLFFKGADVPEADVVVVEATYGDPMFSFPDPCDVYGEVVDFVKRHASTSNILFGAYSLGKAQELVRLINEAGYTPIITEEAAHFSEVYVSNGIALDYVVSGSDEACEMLNDGFVGIVPPRLAKKNIGVKLAEAFNRQTLCCAVSGWCQKFRFRVDASFVLSDHADFSDIVWFVEQTSARCVLFTHGDGTKLKHKLEMTMPHTAFHQLKEGEEVVVNDFF